MCLSPIYWLESYLRRREIIDSPIDPPGAPPPGGFFLPIPMSYMSVLYFWRALANLCEMRARKFGSKFGSKFGTTFLYETIL